MTLSFLPFNLNAVVCYWNFHLFFYLFVETMVSVMPEGCMFLIQVLYNCQKKDCCTLTCHTSFAEIIIAPYTKKKLNKVCWYT